jgi:hypothetical protein
VDGFGVEVIFAALVVSVTTWFTMAEVLRRLFTSPEYTARICGFRVEPDFGRKLPSFPEKVDVLPAQNAA